MRCSQPVHTPVNTGRFAWPEVMRQTPVFVSGPQNNRILAGLRLELGMRLEKTWEPLRCQFARRRVRATLKNTSCRNSSSEADWLYGLWMGRVREAGRHVKRAWPEESKRGDGILGTPGAHWWDSHRQERPRLLVPICSLERPLPRVTGVPQYHLSARPIRLWDKAVSLSLGAFEHSRGRALSGHLSH